MTPPAIKVLLVDDQEMVRAGLRLVLRREPGLEVVGEAGGGAAAVDYVRRAEVDVVVMDVRMPGMDGIEATGHIRALAADRGEDLPRVLILTTFDLDEYAFAAIRAGASGFLLKDAGPRHLVEAVQTVYAGNAVVAPTTTRRLLDRFASRPATPAPEVADELTPRERQVLGQIARGLSNAEIAEHFVLSEATVRTHVTRILGKLGLRDRVQAVVYAYEIGLAGVDRDDVSGDTWG